jgi:hypothetical protein
MKEVSAIRAQEALQEAQLAEVKLMEAEKHVGKIIYVIKASGFQAPSPKPTWSPIAVKIEGGMDNSISNFIQALKHLRQHVILYLSQEVGLLESFWINRLIYCRDCIFDQLILLLSSL